MEVAIGKRKFSSPKRRTEASLFHFFSGASNVRGGHGCCTDWLFRRQTLPGPGAVIAQVPYGLQIAAVRLPSDAVITHRPIAQCSRAASCVPKRRHSTEMPGRNNLVTVRNRQVARRHHRHRIPTITSTGHRIPAITNDRILVVEQAIDTLRKK
ncbi:hypothetical protein Taro_053307 [Colocasia esculenta]|uniref:Uncharacterized protein n=1 Tax=Colocasia esculenta TaxID=4460 RepID=A0A843XKW4_COLES|nr:hypothetical protein [Colocasia esculenta]